MIPLLTMVMLMTTSVTAASTHTLPPCPEKPNCVSSQATDSHHIEPFTVTGNALSALEKLRNLLGQRSDTTVISSDETTIRVEFRTILGFVDDGLFVLDPADGLIHIHSAARSGYWDLGKNRSRMEQIRHAFEKTQKFV